MAIVGLAILVEDDNGQLYLMRTTKVQSAVLQPAAEPDPFFPKKMTYYLKAKFEDIEIVTNDYFDEEQVRRTTRLLEERDGRGVSGDSQIVHSRG